MRRHKPVLLLCAGNDNLRLMTMMTRQLLRVDLADFEGNTSYAEYDDFAAGSAITKYKLLSLGEYRGTAGQCDVKTWTELFWVVSYDSDLKLLSKYILASTELAH